MSHIFGENKRIFRQLLLLIWSMADPGFPLWGGGATNFKGGCKKLLFGHFILKTAWNWKRFTPGGRVPDAPLKSVNADVLLRTIIDFIKRQDVDSIYTFTFFISRRHGFHQINNFITSQNSANQNESKLTLNDLQDQDLKLNYGIKQQGSVKWFICICVMKTNKQRQQEGPHSICMLIIQFMFVDVAWHPTSWVGFYSQSWHVAIGTQVGKVVRKEVGIYTCGEIKML